MSSTASEASTYDLAVIGGGPGGLAAAATAAELGARVVLVDESPALGGQIWRQNRSRVVPAAQPWLARLEAAGVELRLGTTVWQATPPGNLHTSQGPIRARQTVLACGARELLLPFPGWTLPGVHGVGGLQALVHSGLEVRGRRVVLAGSGPLLLQVAASLTSHGAQVLRVAEQAPLSRLARFSLGLGPGKTWQAVTLANPRFRASSWPLEALGTERLEAVRLQRVGGSEILPCDLLAVGFGLTPNLELPRALGCRIEEGAVAVDEHQRSSVRGVFAVGEVCGIKGAPGALVDGLCAGASAGGTTIARPLLRKRDRQRRFGRLLTRTFSLREEIRQLARSETTLCRCEQVDYASVAAHPDWTSAKLASRCGMGLCQGRICGAATQALFGWGPHGVRPPLTPVPVGALFSHDIPPPPPASRESRS